MIKTLIVTDALLQADGTLQIHPALAAWQDKLLQRKQVWDKADRISPLTYYAATLDASPASALANLFQSMPAAAQYWVVSPFHARLTRSSLRVMPDEMLEISEATLMALERLLQPLLDDFGLKLHVKGMVLLLSCERLWDVVMPDFAEITGQSLPDILPQGKDAGAWMRLLSELQMMLHQSPVMSDNHVPIHGVWFWGHGCGVADLSEAPAVATRNPLLLTLSQHLNLDRDAQCCVSEAARLPALLNGKSPWPEEVILRGAGQQVCLTNSWLTACLYRLRPQRWKGM